MAGLGRQWRMIARDGGVETDCGFSSKKIGGPVLMPTSPRSSVNKLDSNNMYKFRNVLVFL